MITITDKKDCCGCGACFNICPKNCITMQADSEGFLYPVIDKTQCINCGLCVKVCPVINNKPDTKAASAWAAKYKDSDVVSNSSSGGVFTALARLVLQRGGVVFGAGYTQNWAVAHQPAQTEEELDNLRRSKYVQSDTKDSFKQVKTFLDAGHLVLFTGTPCQISGLKNFLGRAYDNLLTVDIICHAVPSPLVWQRYINNNFSTADIKGINFRDKHFSWHNYFLNFSFKNGSSAGVKSNFIIKGFKDIILLIKKPKSAGQILFRGPFSTAFLSELINRPSCHACAFKGPSKNSDLTLGDFWGINHVLPAFADDRGISLVLINSAKGQQFWADISNSTQAMPAPLDKVVSFNMALLKSPKPHPNRDLFFKALPESKDINNLILTSLGRKPFLLWLIKKLLKKAH